MAVEDDTYCPEVMKQLSAIQGSLEGANRVMLRNHLETCVAAAMAAGETDAIVDELMDALRYERTATGPSHTPHRTRASSTNGAR